MKNLLDILGDLETEASPEIVSETISNDLADQFLREFTDLLENPIGVSSPAVTSAPAAPGAPVKTTNTVANTSPSGATTTPQQQAALNVAGTNKALDQLKRHAPVSPTAMDKQTTDTMKALTPMLQNITKNPQLSGQLKQIITKSQNLPK